jgi:hypothetical protein
MINLSISKVVTLATGLSVASLSMLEINFQTWASDKVKAQVESAIQEFVKSGGNRDVKRLDAIPNYNFRVLTNQLMSSTSFTEIQKKRFQSLIREGKLGGDSKTIEILTPELVNRNASARMKLKGSQMISDTFYHLILSPEGNCQMVQDLPFVIKN